MGFPDALVIGADTLCDLNVTMIGKPENSVHAEQILAKLFSQPHQVITGLAVIRRSENIEVIDSDITTVFPRKMSPSQIKRHLRGGTWQGKAGAYAIQETGDEFVEKIEGSLTNVIGLPMELLEKILADIGFEK